MKVAVLGDARSVHLRRNLADLAARGVTIDLITHTPCDIPGVTVRPFRVPEWNWRHPGRWRWRRRKVLRDLMRRFDVVNVHFLHDWGLTPDVMEEGCCVLTPWGSDIVLPPGETPPSDEQLEKRRAWLRRAHGITAWGPAFARRIADFAGVSVERIDLIPLGVDVDLFDPDRVRRANLDRRYRVGFFKGFRAVYGPTFLLRAIPSVLEKIPDARFHLIGDGPQREECRRLALNQNAPQAIHWYPPQPHRDLPGFLATWDLSVIPSVCESFGVAALESSAMRVPVVASDVGGLRDTVRDGRTGRLVPPGDPEALAEAVVTLLKNHEERRRMGDVGRERVKRRYDQTRVIDRWIEVYEKVRDRSVVMA